MQRLALLERRTAYQVKGPRTTEWLSALTGALIIFVVSYSTVGHWA